MGTRIKYDDGLRSVTGSDTQAKQFISRAVEHAKTRLHMLPIKVELSVVGSMQYKSSGSNGPWRANSYWIQQLRDQSADKVVSHFARGGAAGIAYVGAVCGGYYGVNINEHINWPGRAEWVTGRTYAHELGHNLGMHHDFASKHGGNNSPGSGSPCDGEGLMSYGSCKPSCRDSQMPDRWSSCSVRDLSRLSGTAPTAAWLRARVMDLLRTMDAPAMATPSADMESASKRQGVVLGAMSTIQTLAPTRTGATSDLPTAGLVRRARLVGSQDCKLMTLKLTSLWSRHARTRTQRPASPSARSSLSSSQFSLH